jgi:hypothetical protein
MTGLHVALAWLPAALIRGCSRSDDLTANSSQLQANRGDIWRFSILGGGAARAQADDWEVGETSLVAEPVLNRLACLIELMRLDREHLATSLTEEVLAFSFAHERIEAWAMTKMNVAHHPAALEGLEVAVDRGHVESRARPLQLLGDLLGGEWLLGPKQDLQHETACGRYAQSLLP